MIIRSFLCMLHIWFQDLLNRRNPLDFLIISNSRRPSALDNLSFLYVPKFLSLLVFNNFRRIFTLRELLRLIVQYLFAILKNALNFKFFTFIFSTCSPKFGISNLWSHLVSDQYHSLFYRCICPSGMYKHSL